MAAMVFLSPACAATQDLLTSSEGELGGKQNQQIHSMRHAKWLLHHCQHRQPSPEECFRRSKEDFLGALLKRLTLQQLLLRLNLVHSDLPFPCQALATGLRMIFWQKSGTR